MRNSSYPYFFDLPDGTLAYLIAVKADADVDSDRQTILDIVNSVVYTAPVPPYTPPEAITLSAADMPAGTIRFNDGSQFSYPENWSVFIPDIPITNAVTMVTSDQQTFMTTYAVTGNEFEEVFAREFNIEPRLQASGLTDFEGEDPVDPIDEDNERRIYFFTTPVWTENVTPQVNFYHLVVGERDGIRYLAHFQSQTTDVANVEMLQVQVLAMAQSFVFGGAAPEATPPG